MSDILITGEVLSSLHLCHITVHYPDYLESRDILKVTSTEHNLAFYFTDGNVLILNFPKGLQFTTDDQVFTISNDRNINVRLALGHKSKIVRSICSDLVGDIRSLLIKSPYDVLRAKDLVIACSDCDAVVSECVNFDRIREIPATNWDQSKEEWFCHGHGSAFDKLKPGAVTPKLTDCFFSDLYFQLKQEVLLHSNYRTDCHNNAVCSKCNNIFGVIEKDLVKLWTHRIKWVTNSECRTLVYRSDEMSLLVSLIDNLSDSLAVNSRIVFEKSSNPRKFLYMCVMDVNLTLLTSLDIEKKNKEVEKDISDNLKAVNISGKRSKSYSSDKKNKPEIYNEGKAEIKVMKSNVIKVLFKLVQGENEETSGWVDNVNVNVFQCAESLFDIVYGKLDESAQVLQATPSGEDTMVGYIARN